MMSQKNLSINDDNYITVQAWMVTKLNLSGLTLNAYALIYGFARSDARGFKGSYAMFAKWLGCSKRRVVTIINKLLEDQLVERHLVPGETTAREVYMYKPVPHPGIPGSTSKQPVPDTPKPASNPSPNATKTPVSYGTSGGEKTSPQRCKNFTEVVNKFHRSGEQISPHIYIYNDSIESNNKDAAPSTRKPRKQPLTVERVQQIVAAKGHCEELAAAVKDFVEYRRQIGKPMTEMALERLLARLKPYKLGQQLEMLDNAIQCNWMTVWPPKGVEATPNTPAKAAPSAPLPPGFTSWEMVHLEKFKFNDPELANVDCHCGNCLGGGDD